MCVGVYTTPAEERKGYLWEVSGTRVCRAGSPLALAEVSWCLLSSVTFHSGRSRTEPWPGWCGDSKDTGLFRWAVFIFSPIQADLITQETMGLTSAERKLAADAGMLQGAI